MYNNIKIHQENKIIEIILNRPERMNAITVDLLNELKKAVIDINNNDDIHVIILSGAGRAFSAGVDLRELESNGTDVSSGGVGKTLDEHANEVIKLLSESPKAVIAKINGLENLSILYLLRIAVYGVLILFFFKYLNVKNLSWQFNTFLNFSTKTLHFNFLLFFAIKGISASIHGKK